MAGAFHWSNSTRIHKTHLWDFLLLGICFKNAWVFHFQSGCRAGERPLIHSTKKFHKDKIKTYFSVGPAKSNKHKEGLMTLTSTRNKPFWGKPKANLSCSCICEGCAWRAWTGGGGWIPQRDLTWQEQGETDKPYKMVWTVQQTYWNWEEQQMQKQIMVPTKSFDLPQPPKFRQGSKSAEVRKPQDITKPM